MKERNAGFERGGVRDQRQVKLAEDELEVAPSDRVDVRGGDQHVGAGVSSRGPAGLGRVEQRLDALAQHVRVVAHARLLEGAAEDLRPARPQLGLDAVELREGRPVQKGERLEPERAQRERRAVALDEPPVQSDQLLAQHLRNVVREPAPAVEQEVERGQGLDDLGTEPEVEGPPAVGVEQRPPAVHLPALAGRRRRRDRAERLVELVEALDKRRRVVERLGSLCARVLESVELGEAAVAQLGVADPLEQAAEGRFRVRGQRHAEAPRDPPALAEVGEDRRDLVGVGDQAGLDDRTPDLPRRPNAVAAAQHLRDCRGDLDRRLARQDDSVGVDPHEAGPPRREPVSHSLLRAERLAEPRDRPVLEEEPCRWDQSPKDDLQRA